MILGLAYKGNVKDTRESPAFYIIKKLKKLGAEVIVYDPLVKKDYDFNKVNNFEEEIKDVDVIAIVTDHDEFKKIKWDVLNRKIAIIDGKGIVNTEEIKKSGHIFKGIGRWNL